MNYKIITEHEIMYVVECFYGEAKAVRKRFTFKCPEDRTMFLTAISSIKEILNEKDDMEINNLNFICYDEEIRRFNMYDREI